MKAILKNYRQSPRKVRLVADLVRGKRTADALTTLQFVDKRASGAFTKVIQSAVANAIDHGKNADTLMIKSVRVDQAPTMRRMMPRARGSASRINKRNSHIHIELAEKALKSTSQK
jgi:large subunit ribosomal protein L22